MRKKENAYKDFMEEFERKGMYRQFTDEEKKFLKERLEWLWTIGDVYGTYHQRYNILFNAVLFFRYGSRYRPDTGQHEDVA